MNTNSTPTSTAEVVKRALRIHVPSLSEAQLQAAWHAMQCEFGGMDIYVPSIAQDASLASFEVRLAQEMLNVSRALNTLGAVAASIGKELPDAAHLEKLGLLRLSQMSFQVTQLFLELTAPLVTGKSR